MFFCRTSSSSTAGKEARIQTGELPAVGCSVLFDILHSGMFGIKSLKHKTGTRVKIAKIHEEVSVGCLKRVNPNV